MNIKLIPDNFDINEYNTVSVHPMQSWQWGEARKKTGVDVVRLGEFKDQKLENVYQLTIHPLPYVLYKIGYLPRSVFPGKDALEFLSGFGKKNNLIFIKIEPYTHKNEFNNSQLTTHNLQLSPHPLFPAWTQMLDITKSEEELLKNMHHKTRYNIRLAEKKGVTIKEESNDKGFEIFSKLYFETTSRQKYHGHTPNYHKIIWKALKDSLAHILIAYYEGKPLAAYELFYFNDTFYYPYGGSSVEHRNVMAANLLMWEAIRLGKKLGAKTFDMWGSLPPDYDPNNPWAGFTRFKEGYGTEFVEMVGSYDLVIHKVFYNLYDTIHKLRSLYLKHI